VDRILKNISSARSMAAKDREARDGVKDMSYSDVSAVASKATLNESEEILVVVAYSCGRNGLETIVKKISNQKDEVGRYATSMLSSRNSIQGN